MIQILIWGSLGRMGQWVRDMAQSSGKFNVVGGVDYRAQGDTVTDPEDLSAKPDVIVDFSRADALPKILAYATKHQIPAVLCSTGYGAEEAQMIDDAAKKIPLLRSGNMSLGVNLLLSVIENMARTLDDQYDIEITEAHHNKKVDSPSGTAEMLADAAKKGRKTITQEKYGRHSKNDPRKTDEIGIHSLRGGTIVGEHTVMFAGPDEVIEVKHTALSRGIFANGALKAAEFLSTAKPGLYNMRHVLNV